MQIAGLDDIDNRIIDLLLKNGRTSYSEIGAAVGLSRTAAKTVFGRWKHPALSAAIRQSSTHRHPPEA